mgnify:FL=1
MRRTIIHGMAFISTICLLTTTGWAEKVNVRMGAAPAVKETTPTDRTGPQIVVTSPDIQRGLKIKSNEEVVTVQGKATDDSGVAWVTVNGQKADLDGQGNFSAEVLLKVGDNKITVASSDIYRNTTSKQFTINREAIKTAKALKETTPAAATLGKGKYYGLFIAVEDYANPQIERLDYPVADTRKVIKTLTDRYRFDPDDITFLANPDRKAIFRAFGEMRQKVTEEDNLLIFYAGHGVWMDDMKQGYWLPKDASGPNDPSDWIPNSTVRDYVKAIKAKHILLVSDACFSGAIFKVRNPFVNPSVSAEKIYQLPSRKAITSGAMKTVPDQSVFVEYLVKRLGQNEDVYLDAQKLFVSFKEAVINNSPNHQTPLYGAINEAGDEGGDFIFILRR